MRCMPSKSSDPQRWLNDIRHNILLARRFTEGVTYDAFRDDTLRFYAVTRCLEIISEASRRLPEDLKARHPEITNFLWYVLPYHGRRSRLQSF
jgi:uncharacterized protein with HEPN domain